MSAEDYLNQKSIELFPVPKQAQPQYSQVVIRRQTQNNKLLRERQQFNKKLKKDFNGLDSTLSIIAKGLDGITQSYKTMLTLVTIAAVSFLGIKQYLDAQDSAFNSDYSGEGSGMSTGKLSEKGKQFIANEEGLRTEAYKDSRGVWTIGIGHTGQVDGKPIGPGMKITKEKAMELFEKDIAKYENYVNSVVKVPVSQNMFDAMVSYSYNVGSLGKQFLKKLNSGDYKGAMAELTTVNPELQARRKREQELFSTDIATNNTLKSEPINAPTVRVTDAGKIRQVKNGSKIGNYIMSNPNKQRNYIELSERAEAYLKETGGRGNITSGAEGNHAKGSGVSHGSGNKIDVTAYKDTYQEWAETAIPFLKNRHTAFVVFEGFTAAQFSAIQKIIYSKIDADTRRLCEGKARQAGWGDRGGKYLDYASSQKYIANGKHLDIGILTDAYSKKDNYNQQNQNQPKPTPKPEQKPKEQSKEQSKQGGSTNVQIPSTNNKQQGGINLSNPSNKKVTKKK